MNCVINQDSASFPCETLTKEPKQIKGVTSIGFFLIKIFQNYVKLC